MRLRHLLLWLATIPLAVGCGAKAGPPPPETEATPRRTEATPPPVEVPPAEPKVLEPKVAVAEPKVVDPKDVEPKEAEPKQVEPSAADDAIRPATEGAWKPTLLPPNDLSDPPERYRNAEGGACVGMSAITHGFWAAKVEDFTLSDERAADVFVRNMLVFRAKDGSTVMPNHPLPGWVVVDGKVRALENEITLVRIAEIIQNRLQPGGGKQKSPAEVRRSHAEAQRFQGRITSARTLREEIARAGGRLVVGALHFDEQLTETAGHAFVLTVDDAGRVFVWDPNARMANDATGSGRLAVLDFDLADADTFSAIRYEIELPDRTTQARQFEYVFPIRTFVPNGKVPALPQPR